VQTYLNVTITAKRATAAAPITLCGPRSAVINGGKLFTTSYLMLVRDSSHINVVGFSVVNGFKGVVLENTQKSLVDGIRVKNVGQDGIRVRYNSKNNVIQVCPCTTWRVCMGGTRVGGGHATWCAHPKGRRVGGGGGPCCCAIVNDDHNMGCSRRWHMHTFSIHLLQNCHITHTGRLWGGFGEGYYVGTSSSTDPAYYDKSDFNTVSAYCLIPVL
jgi:hypothetical protein